MNQPTLAIIGATGTLGQLVCHHVMSTYNKTFNYIVTDYKLERGEMIRERWRNRDVHCEFMKLDVTSEDDIANVVSHADLVLIAVSQREPLIQKSCMKADVPTIDVNAFYSFAERVKVLDNPYDTTNVIMAGLLPGLSVILAIEAAKNLSTVDDVHVGFLQSTNALAGAQGAADMLTIVSSQLAGRHRGFKKKRAFTNGSTSITLRKIQHSEQTIMKNVFNKATIHYWTSWDSMLFNRLVSTLIALRVLPNHRHLFSRFAKHHPDQSEEATLFVELTGLRNQKRAKSAQQLTVKSDYEATALVVTGLIPIVFTSKANGVVEPWQIATVQDLPVQKMKAK
ncbi:hypothetical protein DH09_13080 [Bacillaceae bacterium JMAK1]|nr:hypothetical protein DH09_13080 [Bacillaceae bacterium JMAK1]